MRVNVRCCCNPDRVLGTVDLPRVDKRFVYVWPKVKCLPFEGVVDKSVSIPRLEIAQVAFPDGTYEYAVKSEDRPDEFWDTLPTFRRGDRV